MLGLYREHYADHTVKHFHEQLVKRHGYKLAYTVTKVHMQRAGLVVPAARRPAHRTQRPPRPLAGTHAHQDGPRFAWPPGDHRPYALGVPLDDSPTPTPPPPPVT